MSGYNTFEIQKAIDVALVGSSSITDIVGSGDDVGVYSNPVQLETEAPYPFIVIGESTDVDYSSKSFDGQELTYTIHTWSRSGDPEQSHQMLKAIYGVLHNQSLPILDGVGAVTANMINMRYEFSTVQKEVTNERITHHGSIRFRIVAIGV